MCIFAKEHVTVLSQLADVGSSTARKATAFQRHGRVTALSTAETATMNETAVSRLSCMIIKQHLPYLSTLANPGNRKRKGKEEYLYSDILADTPLTKRSYMDHTVLPANYTMSAFPS